MRKSEFKSRIPNSESTESGQIECTYEWARWKAIGNTGPVETEENKGHANKNKNQALCQPH